MDGSPELTLVVPCYNEKESLPIVLPHFIQACEQNNWALIVVNDGSTDGSGEILQQFTHYRKMKIIHHKVNRGYGGALTSGISQCKTPYLITIDADGQHNLEDIPAMLARHKEEGADLTVGKRIYLGGVENRWRRWGKGIIRFVAKLLFPNLDISDLNSGMKLYRTPIAKVIAPYCPESMAFSDVMTLMHMSLGMKVIEHPVRVSQRQRGKSTIGLNTAIETVIEILNLLVLFKPLRLFLPLALTFILLGSIWGVRFLVMGRGLSTAALLLISVGVVVLSTGLLSEQNAIIIKSDLRERLNQVMVSDNGDN